MLVYYLLHYSFKVLPILKSYNYIVNLLKLKYLKEKGIFSNAFVLSICVPVNWQINKKVYDNLKQLYILLTSKRQWFSPKSILVQKCQPCWDLLPVILWKEMGQSSCRSDWTNLQAAHLKLPYFTFKGQCEGDSDLLPKVTEIKAPQRPRSTEFAYRTSVPAVSAVKLASQFQK